MKLTTLIMIMVILHVSAATLAQKVTLKEKNAPLVDVFNKINAQTGYDFLFTTSILRDAKPVTINVMNEELSDVLSKIFEGQPLAFSIENKSVVISEKETSNIDKVKSTFAQVIVTGTVVDEKGVALPGVTIRVKGNQKQSVTNQNGQFTMVLEKDDIMQFSFVGLQPKEVAVSALKSPATIVLKEAVSSLDDVEVLAYGTTTKRLTTANVVTVSAKEIGENPVSNVLQALESRVPGLYIQQNTGMVGGSFTTSIRNGSSISGSAPLYIVDGVQFPAGSTLPQLPGLNTTGGTMSGNNQFARGNALNYLNPEDIENVTILKDADATAIYGSRGAYGVILITTKKAKPGQAQLVANIYDGISVRGIAPQLLNTDQYLMIRREAFKNDHTSPGSTDLDLNGAWSTSSYTDWRKYYLGDVAQNQNASLTYSGGANNTNYLISGNLHRTGMIEKGTGSDLGGDMRMDINNTSKNGKFFIDMTATYNLSRNDQTPIDFSSALTNAPNAPLPVLPNGGLNWYQSTNPAAALNAEFLNTNQNLLTSLTIRYNFLKYFTLNAQISYNSLEGSEFQAQPTSYFVPTATVNTQTTSNMESFRTRTVNFDPNVEYQDLFFKKLKLDSRVGITLQDQYSWTEYLLGTNFASDALLSSPTSASNPVISSYIGTPNRYGGAFITSALNWDNKYLLSLNGRRDGSTNFGPGNRFGNFGSIAGAWIVSQEPWMKDISPVMDFFKIRGSYGSVGGDQIAAYSYLNRYSVTSPYSGSAGLIPQFLANSTLHWEAKKTEEIGFTMTFLKSRIELEANYYRSWTSNSLLSQPEPLITGFSNITVNSPDAKVLTYGYEATLLTTNIKSQNFKWTTTLNFSVPKSKLLSFPGLTTANSTNTSYPTLQLGMPTTGVRLYNYAGVNPQTGVYQFINGAGVKQDYYPFGTGSLNPNTDETQFVDLAPKYYGGIGNSFTYKRFNADIFMQLTSKNAPNFLGATAAAGLWPGAFNFNPTTAILSRWQKPGDITDVPALTTSQLTGYFAAGAFRSSTGAYSPLTFLRVNNVSLGYDLTSDKLKKAGVKHLNVYLRGQNLWVFSKYKDLDPENMSLYNIGPLRTFVVGFNVSL